MDVVKVNTKVLQEYEKKFLDAIFEGSTFFDTEEVKKNSAKKMLLSGVIKKLEKDLQQEVVKDVPVYVVGFRMWRILKTILVTVGIMIFYGAFPFLSDFSFVDMEIAFWLITVYCVVVFLLFFFFNPRLNREGQVLREEWLGFKLYLETAERYRMQNLTPETFEKYLPYAIIFGVEKKWGKAFDTVRVPEPVWYSGSPMTMGTLSGAPSQAFSPAVFSASFAACCFSSSICACTASSAIALNAASSIAPAEAASEVFSLKFNFSLIRAERPLRSRK